MKKIGIATSVLLTVVVISYFAFNGLGGNNPIVIELMNSNPPNLAGKTYRGTPQDKKLGETFNSIESLLALHPGKKVHTIYYVEPAGKLDTMEVFVGLDLPFAPAELEAKHFTESRYLLATIKSNRWVMPGPDEVKQTLQDFAKENKVTLSGIFIDKIVDDSEVQVIAPIK
ncbi:hypothetical protein [Algoriphagus terrigena]|uniref:hypothetical protein n=1 Tax=Algoriphagus terrigena TaxID=344884 RepID=UPI0004187F5A|nr:hypothetical protein [Algoriphagus terrigena]